MLLMMIKYLIWASSIIFWFQYDLIYTVLLEQYYRAWIVMDNKKKPSYLTCHNLRNYHFQAHFFVQDKLLAKLVCLVDSCNERQYFDNHSANSKENLQETNFWELNFALKKYVGRVIIKNLYLHFLVYWIATLG